MKRIRPAMMASEARRRLTTGGERPNDVTPDGSVATGASAQQGPIHSRNRSAEKRRTRERWLNDPLRLPINPGQDLLQPEDWIAIGTVLQLSARELSIAILTLEGRTRRDMARILRLSPETVRTFIDRLHKKLRVKDRVGVVLRIVRAHLVLASRR
jgi:DNA-binding CsgD family transcriptional regulator